MSSSRHLTTRIAHKTSLAHSTLPWTYIKKKNSISVCTIHIGRRCYIIMKRKANVCKRQAAEHFLWRCFVVSSVNVCYQLSVVDFRRTQIAVKFLSENFATQILNGKRLYIRILEQNWHSGCDNRRVLYKTKLLTEKNQQRH